MPGSPTAADRQKMARVRAITETLQATARLSEERKELIKELHRKYSFRYLAGELGVSPARVWQIATDQQKPPPRPAR